jgi:hypothetical protein
MDNGTVGSAFDHAAESWDNDVVECDMVKTIVRGHTACHISGVVMPLKKALVIEIKCLVSGVGGNLRWEDYAEWSPDFTILLMRLNLFDLNARLRQEERSREVIPECVASEVEFLEFVPLRRKHSTGERVSGILEFAEKLIILALNPHAIGREMPDAAGTGERRHCQRRLPRVSPHEYTRQAVGPSLDPPKGTVQRDLGLQTSYLPPTFEAAVRFDSEAQ